MDITSANAVLTLAIANVFNAPQQLQNFAAEDIFTTEDIAVAEVQMGVDGKQSGGRVNVPVPQTIALMADSPSIQVFDDWMRYVQVNQGIAPAQATVILPSLNKKWTCTNGILIRGKVLPDAAKTLVARRFVISWESVTPANS